METKDSILVQHMYLNANRAILIYGVWKVIYLLASEKKMIYWGVL